MSTGQPPTSIWLVPGEPARRLLRAHIVDLAARLDTPVFDPHITLTTTVVDDAAAATALAGVAAATAPIQLRAGRTAHGPDRFTALFVVFDDERIHELAAQVSTALGLAFRPDQLHPHVSLAYAADLPIGVRTDLAAGHTFEGTSMRFDAVVANRSTGSMDDIARWHTFAVEPLSG